MRVVLARNMRCVQVAGRRPRADVVWEIAYNPDWPIGADDRLTSALVRDCRPEPTARLAISAGFALPAGALAIPRSSSRSAP
jgi:hypothetical protein